jgi:hypothetical protein
VIDKKSVIDKLASATSVVVVASSSDYKKIPRGIGDPGNKARKPAAIESPVVVALS